MNIVDSSGWLEYFADGPNADFFASAIEDASELIVPTISIYEVYKRMRQSRGDSDAAASIAAMRQGTVVELNVLTALTAARLSADLKLPMADSIILATARIYGATLWTQDSDFKDVPGVKYVEKT